FVESMNGADGITFDKAGNLWVAPNQADQITVLNKDGRVIAQLGAFLGIRNDGAPRGLLFPASLVIVGDDVFVTNLALPLPGATIFGDAGQYEKLRGRAFGEVDPNDRQSKKITDIEFAPTNSRGMVEYSTDIIILRPIDPNKSNHRLFYELSNRGTILSLRVV